ncbi:MAG: GGDEF domain-containing protein [bacterium]|nr:GGDEF domain-containing protein [bacterium]
MTNEVFGFEVDSGELAIAASCGTLPDREFVMKNPKFVSAFDGIDNPGRLNSLITGRSKNKTIVRHGNRFWALLEFTVNTDYVVYVLKNITHETELLQKLKEKLRDLTAENAMYSRILTEDLPLGLMIVDKDYNVSYANTPLKRFFHIPARAKLKKCYNYVKEIKPCSNCILEDLSPVDMETKRKKTFSTPHGEFITAELHPLEGEDRVIITFRDTTKEIVLIREIKKQQEILEEANQRIAEQNDILKRLSNINVLIGQYKNMDDVLGIVTNSIIDTFSSSKGAMLLFSSTGHIGSASFSGDISPEERASIIEYVGCSSAGGTTAFDGFDSTGSSGSAGGTDGTDAESLKEKLKDYIQMEMDDQGQAVGKLFLYKPEKTVEHSILELFLVQVNNYLENLKLQIKLEEVAQTDSLTGVFNRYYFDKQFEKETALSLRFGQPLSLIIVDVNGLKQANDTIGHEAGDVLIKETATIIGQNISVFDTIFRIGGDEFIVLLTNCPESQLNVMLMMLKEIQSVATAKYKGQQLPVRFSLGGACSTEVTHEELKTAADQNMYRDKETFYETNTRYR